MKLFKKVMSLIIASVMMLQVAAFAAPAPADVEGTYYENAAKLLSALEIMIGDGSSFNGDNNITRAEFTKIMVVAAGHANIVSGYKPTGVFTDVATSEWYAPYVEFGKDMGAINGMGDGTFAPNANVTGEQAVKMMVSTIGYGLRASEEGGYPAGYITVAQDIGALKGISNIDMTAPMTRGQAAVLCANILDIDVMKRVSGGDVENWESKAGVTLLSEKFSTYKLEGIVSANSATSIWEASGLKAGEVEITAKGEKYELLVGETDIDTQIAKTVTAYYTYDEETEDSTVICYSINKKNNDIVEVDLADIELDAVKDRNDKAVRYWANEDDNETEEIDIEAMPAILVNGATTASTDDLWTMLEDAGDKPGKVVFMDTDSTKGAETVMLTVYETFVIEYLDADDYTILDEISGASVEINVEKKDVTATFVDVNGKELSFDSLQEGDVLSIAASNTGTAKKIFHVIVSDKKAEGVVDTFGTDANGKTIVCLDNGEEYQFGDAFEAWSAANGGHGIRLAQGVELYLDAFGRIAKYEKASTGEADGEYGFILDYVQSQSTTGSIEMKLFTADGEFVTLPLGSKVKIDGTKYTTDATILDALDASIIASNNIYGGGGYSKDAVTGAMAMVSPMLYKLDSDGTIKEIDTPYKGSEEDEYTLGKIKAGSSGPKEMAYNSQYKGFDYTTAINSSAVIFAVPSDSALLDNDKHMRIYKSSEFQTENKYKLQLFNTDRESRVYTYGVHVMGSTGSDTFKTGETESAQRQRPYFIVTKVSKTLVEDDYGDEIVTMKITGNEEGSVKSITIDPDYYNNGQYIKGNNSIADHLYNGVTYNESGTGTGTARITAHGGEMDAARAKALVMPGDIFRYGNNSEGYVNYVRTIYLAHENIFLSNNEITNNRRYQSSDFAIPVEKDGSTVLFATISNPASGNTATVFTIADGYIQEQHGGTAIVDADGKYNPDALATNLTYAVNKVIVYDAEATNEAKMVTTGSVADIVDTSNPLTAATPCIVRVFNSGIKCVVVLKNLPDNPPPALDTLTYTAGAAVNQAVELDELGKATIEVPQGTQKASVAATITGRGVVVVDDEIDLEAAEGHTGTITVKLKNIFNEVVATYEVEFVWGEAPAPETPTE